MQPRAAKPDCSWCTGGCFHPREGVEDGDWARISGISRRISLSGNDQDRNPGQVCSEVGHPAMNGEKGRTRRVRIVEQVSRDQYQIRLQPDRLLKCPPKRRGQISLSLIPSPLCLEIGPKPEMEIGQMDQPHSQPFGESATVPNFLPKKTSG